LAVKQGVLSGVLNCVALAPELGDFHVTFGESSGLSNQQLVDLSHGLWSFQVSYEDLVLVVHSVYGESERDTDGEWESFWDDDNKDDDNNVGRKWQFPEQDLPPPLTRRHVDYQEDDEGSQYKERSNDGEASESVSQVGQLPLDWSVLIQGLLFFSNSSGGVFTDGAHNGFSLASDNDGASSQEWIVINALPLTSIEFAVLFIGSLWLVYFKINRFNNKAIGWYT